MIYDLIRKHIYKLEIHTYDTIARIRNGSSRPIVPPRPSTSPDETGERRAAGNGATARENPIASNRAGTEPIASRPARRHEETGSRLDGTDIAASRTKRH